MNFDIGEIPEFQKSQGNLIFSIYIILKFCRLIAGLNLAQFQLYVLYSILINYWVSVPTFLIP